jgi:hypothetical protein
MEKYTVLTVKMVGVTNAQQTFQKMLGWNPIIISISSQNLCKPANRQTDKQRPSMRCMAGFEEGVRDWGQALEPFTQIPLARDGPNLVLM